MHYSGVGPKPSQGKDSNFMVRARDVKGRYISIKKTPKDIFGPRKIPHINSYDRYIGSSSRVAKISTCWQPKAPQPATVENP